MTFANAVVPHLGQLQLDARRWSDPEDLVQDTVARGLVKWHLFRGGSVLAWLRCVMRSVAINRYHRAKRRREVITDDPPAQVTEAVMGASDVFEAVAALPSPQRDVVLARVLGATYDEIAVGLGIPVGTVMSRLHRARGRLRRCHLVPHGARNDGTRRDEQG